jgi:hypothetical protein
MYQTKALSPSESYSLINVLTLFFSVLHRLLTLSDFDLETSDKIIDEHLNYLMIGPKYLTKGA